MRLVHLNLEADDVLLNALIDFARDLANARAFLETPAGRLLAAQHSLRLQFAAPPQAEAPPCGLSESRKARDALHTLVARASESIGAGVPEGGESRVYFRRLQLHPIFVEVWNGLTADEKKSLGKLESFEASQTQAIISPWFKAFLAYDPQTNLRKVHVPVLALNGTSDVQVVYTQNIPAIEKALRAAGNHQVTIKVLPGLNHLFQASKTGNPADYTNIQETLNPAFLDAVGTWFDEVIVKKK